MTLRYTLFILAATIFAACSTDKEDSMTGPDQYTIDQFYKNVNVFGGSFSSDGSKLLVTSNETGIYNVYALPVDGSEREQLSNSTEESIFAIGYFPNDDRFLFSADQGGNEITHLYLQDTDGTTTDLTPEEGARASFAGWAKDLTKFYFLSNKRDANFMDVYEMEIDDFSSTLIYENVEGLNVSAISDDGSFLALVKPITTNNSDMYLLNRATGELQHLSEHEGDVQYDPQFFSPDNSKLYYLTDEGDEFQHLRSMDLASGTTTKEFEVDWDVWYAYQSFNDKYRVIGYNADGKTVVKLFDLKAGEEVSFPDVDGKDVSSVNISRDEKHMRITAADARTPSDLYVYHFESGELKRLTNNLNPEISYDDLVDAQVIRYKSFDGLEIPAILYKPLQASAKNKVPGMIWVHGGPGGQSRQSYFPLIQYMVNQGYTVLAVNNRGSSGYGKTFFAADNKRHGEDDLQDCVYGKKWLEKQDYIDADKIGIIGGSYGGYMTMAALTFTPEEFDVGVNIFGVTNWLRTLTSIPEWWESFREALYSEMGDPYNPEDSARLHRISPLFHAENVTKPLMVLQGANDPRVLQVESDEIVAAVETNGVPVRYVLFHDEGHGFRKKENEIEGYGKIVTFLDEYLKGERPVETPD